jgi:hypothetical protein
MFALVFALVLIPVFQIIREDLVAGYELVPAEVM